MTTAYFADMIRNYAGGNDVKDIENAKTILKQKSEDLRNMYYSNPKGFTDYLIRMGFFDTLESESDVALHNEMKRMLYDLGIFRRENPLDIAKVLLNQAQIPSAYIAEDEIGG